MNQEIKEYQEFANQMRENLEATYNYCMMSMDKLGAHEAVKTMMEYGLIDKSDPRVSTKTKIFEGSEGIDVRSHDYWGLFDYRNPNSLGFIPRYIFARIRNYITFYVDCIEHWGKRVEGKYTGDVKVQAKPAKIKITQANYFKVANNDLEDLEKYLESSGRKLPNYNEIKELLNAGVIRIFHIEIMGEIVYKYRTLGWALMKMSDSGDIEFKTIIKYEALYNSWIDIKDFLKKLSNQLISMIPGTQLTVNVGHMLPYADAMKHQEEMMNATKVMDKDAEVRAKKQAEETQAINQRKAALEAERAAKKAARAASRKTVKADS